MKNALVGLRELIPIGGKGQRAEKFEKLQEATMNYINAKGVGLQFTQRGKDRMDISLDIATMCVENMEFFSSKARIKDICRYEKEMFSNNNLRKLSWNAEALPEPLFGKA